MCYATSSSVTSHCKSYSSSGSTGYGIACFNKGTTGTIKWYFYRSSYCAYAYACNSNSKCVKVKKC